MRFPLLIALSHLRSRHSDSGVSAITAIAIAGVTIGVTALIMVLAVMEGFEIALRDKLLGNNAHLVVLSYEGVFAGYDETAAAAAEVPGVVAAAPFVYSEAMLRSDAKSTGVIVKGIDPARSSAVTDVAANLKRGPGGELRTPAERAAALAGLAEPAASAGGAVVPGILVGDALAEELEVAPGDTVNLINPVGGGVGPMGFPLPTVQPFRVAGVFSTGMLDFDSQWTYITIPAAQAFYQSGPVVTGIEARVADIDGVEAVSEAVEERLRYPFHVKHWKGINEHLFRALKLEKLVMGVILSLITVVAGMNIVGTLILVVITRTREISILRAMGASTRQIRAVFVLEGLIVGLIGTFLGAILGLLGCAALARTELPLGADLYFLETLPVAVEPLTVLVVVVVAIAIAFFCTLYPTARAAGVDPVEGLRYE